MSKQTMTKYDKPGFAGAKILVHGTVYTQVQDPYPDTVMSGYTMIDGFIAHAMSDDGDHIMFFWKVTNPEAEDQSDACNWSNYTISQE